MSVRKYLPWFRKATRQEGSTLQRSDLPKEVITPEMIESAYKVAAVLTGRSLEELQQSIEWLSGFSNPRDTYEVLSVLIRSIEPDHRVVEYVRQYGQLPVKVTAGTAPTRQPNSGESEDDDLGEPNGLPAPLPKGPLPIVPAAAAELPTEAERKVLVLA